MVGVAVTASESETEEEPASDFGVLGDSEEDGVAIGSVCAKPAYGHPSPHQEMKALATGPSLEEF